MNKRSEAWKKFAPELRVADIILTHNERSALSRGIQAATGSYWNQWKLFLPKLVTQT
jgi:hypothetical protein